MKYIIMDKEENILLKFESDEIININAGDNAIYYDTSHINGKIKIDLSNVYNKIDEEGYDRGREEGHSEGLDEGYDEGREVGFDEGFDEGHEKGLNEGDSEGYDRGYEDGYSEGYDKGYDEGYDSFFERTGLSNSINES